jgi:hypothetical protein
LRRTGHRHQLRFSEVGPGFFSTLGIPLLAGREFRRADSLGAPKVAVVNETREEIQSRQRASRQADARRRQRPDIEIIGPVKDVK